MQLLLGIYVGVIGMEKMKYFDRIFSINYLNDSIICFNKIHFFIDLIK